MEKVEENPPEEITEITYTKKQLYQAAGFTSLFFVVPVGIMMSNTLFNKFNSFHSRIFKLEKRSAGGLAGFAFLASLGYCSILFPLYYKGVMRIFDLEGIGQIKRIMNAKMEKILEEDAALDFRGRIQEAVAHDEKLAKQEAAAASQKDKNESN